MKIITWNCNMAFRKKWKEIIVYRPDLLIIQECEQESKYKIDQLIPDYNESLWFGENENKGVGVFSFNDFHIQISPDYNQKFKYIIPIVVSGTASFNLFAIWAMPDKKLSNGYVGQIWNALNDYDDELLANSVLVGDFNSNAIWNDQRKHGNHADVVEYLERLDIVSVYHHIKGEKPGEESLPTIYLLKQLHKPFHLDYCFVPSRMLTSFTSIEVGSSDDWMTLSDHMPVIIDGLNPN